VEITRRNLVRNAVTAGGLALAATTMPGVLRSATASAAPAPALAPTTAPVAPPTGSTLEQTFTTGTPGAGGYRPVIAASGEPHHVREGLGVAAEAGRASRRQGLISFVQLSDVHIVDAQSPLRLEWTDRLDDPSPLPALGLF